MRQPIVILENVGKRYHPVRNSFVSPWSWFNFRSSPRVKKNGLAHTRTGPEQCVWALRGINASIYPGEIVGIIGHNGAGKSTLLKLLSRITSPSEGRITIRGTIASLLEVGVGFHPDLTGRENVYLSGALLKLSKREIDQSMSSIKEFAELGDAFDSPVRTYSSGMYTRLGFSVAAHLRSDIILLDEILAVGDLRFQQKCLSFLRDLQRRGVTVLVVSHNLFVTKALCSRVLYLRSGQLVYDGDPVEAITMYEKDSYLSTPDWARSVQCCGSSHAVEILDIQITSDNGHRRNVFQFGEPLRLEISVRCTNQISDLNIVVSIIRQDGLPCCAYSSHLDGLKLGDAEGLWRIQMTVPHIKWVADRYRVDVLVWDRAFEKLYAAAKGPYLAVQHPLYSREFGVFHEEAMWSLERMSHHGQEIQNNGEV